jgi:hypothetical protein
MIITQVLPIWMSQFCQIFLIITLNENTKSTSLNHYYKLGVVVPSTKSSRYNMYDCIMINHPFPF